MARGSGLSSELAQGVLRGVELASPVFFIGQCVKEPACNPILFLGRQGRQLRHIIAVCRPRRNTPLARGQTAGDIPYPVYIIQK